nr:PREDICTED: glomulin [Bemisia tabaci]
MEIEEEQDMNVPVKQKTEKKEDEELLQAILEDGNEVDLATWDLWEVIPRVFRYLSKSHAQKDEHLHLLSASALIKIASAANPKEFILILLSQLEEDFDDARFCTLLRPLQSVLFRLPDENGKSFHWCLTSIHDCLTKHLCLPGDFNFEDREKVHPESDEYQMIICKVYEELIFFYQTIQYEILKIVDVPKSKKFEQIFVSHLVKILGRPLVQLNFEGESSSSSLKKSVENLLNLIFSMSVDVISFVKKTEPLTSHKFNSENSDCIPLLASANFYYLIFCERLGPIEKIPKVYSTSYLRSNIFPLASALILCEDSLIRRKGLLLSNFMLEELDSCFFTESVVLEHFMRGLTTCITYEKTEDNRKLSFTVFKNYLCQLRPKEKYLVFLNLHTILTNSSIKAYVITCIKDSVIQYYQHPLFRGKCLFDLVDLYCKLPAGSRTDLMEFANETIASLNFIRFLIIRDRNNKLGSHKYLRKIHEILLDPLAEALKTSRVNWQLKLKEIDEGILEGNKVSMTVGGQRLPDMPKEEQIGIVTSAFNCIDLLESLSKRVNECFLEISIES